MRRKNGWRFYSTVEIPSCLPRRARFLRCLQPCLLSTYRFVHSRRLSPGEGSRFLSDCLIRNRIVPSFWSGREKIRNGQGVSHQWKSLLLHPWDVSSNRNTFSKHHRRHFTSQINVPSLIHLRNGEKNPVAVFGETRRKPTKAFALTWREPFRMYKKICGWLYISGYQCATRQLGEVSTDKWNPQRVVFCKTVSLKMWLSGK